MFSKILIADRGEIAVRIIKACRKLGIKTVIIYSEADKDGLPVKMADESYCVGPSDIKASYMNMAGILMIAKYTSVEAIHPGYGILSENEEFVRLCEENKICYIGPSFECIQSTSNKFTIKMIAKNLEIPVIKGYMIHGEETAETIGSLLGYPLMIKKINGGGGDGIWIIRNREDYHRFVSGHSVAEGLFFAEKCMEQVKHIEVQILGDRKGKIHILGDRDCSIQLQQKKIIEECPAAEISGNIRTQLYTYARQLAEKVKYRNAGTVEFLVDNNGNIYFMEFNSRLQVEHGITEMVTGLDLVELQIKVACIEENIELPNSVIPRGHALECRIYAESMGKIKDFVLPEADFIRIDHTLTKYMHITPYYNPLLGKIMVWGADRRGAIRNMAEALEAVQINGAETNLRKLKKVISHQQFQAGNYYTGFFSKYIAEDAIEMAGIARRKILAICDSGSFREYYPELTAANCIQFAGYERKLREARLKSKEIEAVIMGTVRIDGIDCMMFALEPGFLTGSMGLAAGEKITRAFELAVAEKLPVISITASGGARMQEGIFSLYQMGKTTEAVRRHSEKGLLYVSVISNPTLGGVSASFASLADVIIMEEDAVFGFTGKRIIEETMGKKLPNEFQSADFMFRHGQIDRITKEKNLRDEIIAVLKLHR